MNEVQSSSETTWDRSGSLSESFMPSREQVDTDTAISIHGQPISDDCRHRQNRTKTETAKQDVVAVPSPVQIILSLTISMLVRCGSLDANERVSKYLPEYIAKGGKDVGIQQLLLPKSALTERDGLVTLEDVSELVRRADGRSLEEFTAETMTGSLKVDLHQKVAVAQEQLRCSQNDSEESSAQEKCGLDEASSCRNLPNRSKLYPETIPPHLLHPCAEDFSVVNQGRIGKALLTHRRWQQGDFMARFDGVTVPEVMLHTLQKSSKIHLWDPYFIGNLAHSCGPNVMLDMAEHEMWALQDIEPDSMLSMDYASTEDYLFRTFRCECHAAGCRGEVTGRKQRRSSWVDVSSKSI